MALIPGAIPVTGFLGPTDSTDVYAVTDAIYGIDGMRNVADATAMYAITAQRRRKGMIVGTQDDGKYWKLLTDGPWAYDSTDWALFIAAGPGPITPGLWENIGGNIVTSSSMLSPLPNVLPYGDDLQDLGSKLNRWKDIYLGSVIDFSTNLDFVVGGGSPDDSVIMLDNTGVSVYSGKVIKGQASTNQIDLDLGGSLLITTDNGAAANNKLIALASTGGAFAWSDGFATGSLSVSNPNLSLVWVSGLNAGGIIINSAYLDIAHNTGIKISNDTWWDAAAQIVDNLGNDSIDTNNRLLTSVSTIDSLDWENRFNLDATGIVSIDWNNRFLQDALGVQSVLWSDRILYDAASSTSLEWDTRILVDSLFNVSLDWANRNLQNSANVITIDWENMQMFTPAITAAKIDWNLDMIRGSEEKRSIDWTNRILYNEVDVATLSWLSNEGSPAQVDLYSSGLTGSGMAYVTLQAATIPGYTGEILILGDHVSLKTNTGYGLNTSLTNLTTLNGSDLNINSDGFATMTTGTDFIVHSGATIDMQSGGVVDYSLGQFYADTTSASFGFGLMTGLTKNGFGTFADYVGMFYNTDYVISAASGHLFIGSNGASPSGSHLDINLSTGVTTFSSLDGSGIQYASDYSAGYTDRSLIDKAYADSTFVNDHKYVYGPASFTGGTVTTITHGLNTTDIIVEIIDTAVGQKVWGAKVNNYTTTSVDVTLSVTGTYKVVIIG